MSEDTTGTAEVTITPVSDADLSIAQPADISTDAAGPSGATVTYPAPAVTDPDDSTPPAPSCTPASGSVFSIGATTVTCTATDPDDANGPVSVTFTVTVHGAAGQLAALGQAAQGAGPGTSLSDKTAQAQAYLSSGDTHDTCTTLGAFVHEVNAQTGKSIPPATASPGVREVALGLLQDKDGRRRQGQRAPALRLLETTVVRARVGRLAPGRRTAARSRSSCPARPGFPAGSSRPAPQRGQPAR